MTAPPSHPFDFADTIVAQATMPGRGALAIVRLAGPRAHALARQLTTLWPATPRRATRSALVDAEGRRLDDAVVIRYDAPASFTGEDAVELVTHGGLVVPATIIAALVALGARPALPGEFTRRALLNGKLDILQAEASADLVDAKSRAAQQSAIRQLDGGLSRRVLALRDQVVGLEALIAYDIDFPEEDDGPIAPERITRATDDLVASLERLIATAHAGELVREGALVVLAGAPNVGKSSLFNALVGEARAIVTDIPGTTRDAIEAVIDTPKLPLRLVDTAGLRDAIDPVEQLGVKVTESYAARAAVLLACGDDAESLCGVTRMLRATTGAPIVLVRTKADLALTPIDLERAASELGAASAVDVSAETGQGLDALLDAVVAVASRDASLDETAPMLTRARHRVAVQRALDETRAFRDHWRAGDLPAAVAAVHLRSAISALEDLIGRVDVEDVLDEVFRRFCVGK